VTEQPMHVLMTKCHEGMLDLESAVKNDPQLNHVAYLDLQEARLKFERWMVILRDTHQYEE
jgi:hypothetical protein